MRSRWALETWNSRALGSVMICQLQKIMKFNDGYLDNILICFPSKGPKGACLDIEEHKPIGGCGKTLKQKQWQSLNIYMGGFLYINICLDMFRFPLASHDIFSLLVSAAMELWRGWICDSITTAPRSAWSLAKRCHEVWVPFWGNIPAPYSLSMPKTEQTHDNLQILRIFQHLLF